MLSNKNIIVTGVGKGLGFDLLNKIISYNDKTKIKFY